MFLPQNDKHIKHAHCATLVIVQCLQVLAQHIAPHKCVQLLHDNQK
jgi:hypothetical protein